MSGPWFLMVKMMLVRCEGEMYFFFWWHHNPFHIFCLRSPLCLPVTRGAVTKFWPTRRDKKFPMFLTAIYLHILLLHAVRVEPGGNSLDTLLPLGIIGYHDQVPSVVQILKLDMIHLVCKDMVRLDVGGRNNLVGI